MSRKHDITQWLHVSFFKKIFILTALGLCCCVQDFSSCGERGLLSSCGVWASHSSGFSSCRAQALGHTGFSSCGRQALLPHGMWNLPGPRIELVSPALAHEF